MGENLKPRLIGVAFVVGGLSLVVLGLFLLDHFDFLTFHPWWELV